VALAVVGGVSCVSRVYNAAQVKDSSEPAYFILKEGTTSFFKKEVKGISELGEWDVCELKPGKKYTYVGKEDLVQGHYMVRVNHPVFDCGFRTGYVFAEHVNLGGKHINEDNETPVGHYLKIGASETLLKKTTGSASELEPSTQKCGLGAGELILVQEPPELVEGHYLINLRDMLAGCSFSKGYVFAEHVAESSAGPQMPILESYTMLATLYTIEPTLMEGGPMDRCSRPLGTLEKYLAGKASYVGVAMDTYAFPYGTRIRIPEIEKRHNGGRYIDFRVVDTGSAFIGKGKGRMDICVGDNQDDIYYSPFKWVSKSNLQYHVIERGTAPVPYCR
jgi:3D (Asp-Asp-Asp) domain-containing protein